MVISRTVRILITLLLPLLFSFVLLQSTYLSFERIKLPFVSSPLAPTNNSMALNIPARAGKSADVLLLTIQNEDANPADLEARLNEILLIRIHVPPHSTRDYTTKLPTPAVSSNTILLTGTNNGRWSLASAEVRNLYGSSKNPFLRYVIVNRDLEEYQHAPVFLAGFVFLFLFFVGAAGDPVRRPVLLLPFAVFLFALLLLPLFTTYRVLISPRTFILILLILYAQSLFRAYRSAVTWADGKRAGGAAIIQGCLIVAGICSFFTISMLHSLKDYGGNYSGFLYISEHYLNRNPILKEKPEVVSRLKINPGYGFDSQFFYFITFDPFLSEYQDRPGKYRRVVDNAPFRYRRVGFPLLTKLFSFDRPDFYPTTMVMLILASHCVGAFFLFKIVRFYNKNPFSSFLYILIPAFTLSLRVGLPESIAACFFLGGFYFYLKQKSWYAAAFFVLSMLVRETSSLAILIIASFEFLRHRDQRRAAGPAARNAGEAPALQSGSKVKSALILISSLFPYFAWRFFVGLRLSDAYGWRAFFFEPPNFAFPFTGITQLISNLNGHFQPAALPLLLIALLGIGMFVFFRNRDLLSLLVLLYSLLAVSLSYQAVWLDVSNAERQTFESFLFALLLLISLPQKEVVGKRLLVIFFAFLFIYDWFFLSVNPAFRAGLLWDYWQG